MRFKSAKTGPYQVLAVSGTNTISFAISAAKAGTKGLLGFAVERSDPEGKQDFYAFGFKVFPSLIPKPDEKTRVKTSRHPVQSFVWDDFTAKPDHKYEYVFHPLKGTPKKLDRTAEPVAIRVQTEPLFSTLEHDIFFNRGVASSQAYTREFGNKKPDQLKGARQAAREGMAEPPARRRHPEIHRRRRIGRHAALLLLRVPLPARRRGAEGSRRSRRRRAADRRRQEQQAQGQERQGAGAFPRAENLAMIEKVGLPKASVFLREARTNAIQHNKFMVLLKGQQQRPAEVWTGSTNISDGGIHGQTNVGHWVREPETAKQVPGLLGAAEGRPWRQGGRGPRDRQRQPTRSCRTAVEQILAPPESWPKVKKGITPIFSPRSGSDVLDMYAAMVDEATDDSCITLAFGINKTFKELLEGQQGGRPYRLLPAREGGQAQPARQGPVRPAQRQEQHLPGVRLLSSTSRSINGRRRPTRASCSSIPT